MPTTKLHSVQLNFTNDLVIGGQVSFVDTIEDGGKSYPLPERTTGLDCGGNPEYATKVETALGEALTAAVATNAELVAGLGAANAEIERLEGELAAANGNTEALGAEVARLGAALETSGAEYRRVAAALDAAERRAAVLDTAQADEPA